MLDKLFFLVRSAKLKVIKECVIIDILTDENNIIKG
jgi:hypothetical protein